MANKYYTSYGVVTVASSSQSILKVGVCFKGVQKHEDGIKHCLVVILHAWIIDAW